MMLMDEIKIKIHYNILMTVLHLHFDTKMWY